MNRVKIAVLFSTAYFFYYLARYNYPLALPFIREEFALTAAQVGLIATMLTLGYAVGQLVNGVLVDRKGPRLMMTLGGLGTMAANLIMGGSSLYTLFVLGWLVNGYFQAMGYPSTLKLVVNWFEPHERGRAVGASEFAQSVASIVVLPLCGFLAAQISWRLVFAVPATLMGIATIWYWAQAQDEPPGAIEMKPGPLVEDFLFRYRIALADWRLVCANFSYGFSQFVRYAMITWIPMYLFGEGGLSIFKAALGGTAFQIGGAIGSVLVGWLSDLPLFRTRRWLLIAVGMVVSALAGVAVGTVPLTNMMAVMAALFVCGVGIEALEVAYFLIPTDYLGVGMTATGVGCMNATGKLTASLQGIILGTIIDRFGFGSAFGVAGGFGLLAAVLILPSGRKHG
jgi:OPA family glycerol-3-phosphate transporter-like MFS transporter